MSNINIKPLKDKVLIRRDAAKQSIETSIGLLVIPESYQEKENFGTVIARGPEADELLQIGSRVLFGKHDGMVIPRSYFDDASEYIMMTDKAIRAVILNEGS